MCYVWCLGVPGVLAPDVLARMASERWWTAGDGVVHVCSSIHVIMYTCVGGGAAASDDDDDDDARRR